MCKDNEHAVVQFDLLIASTQDNRSRLSLIMHRLHQTTVSLIQGKQVNPEHDKALEQLQHCCK